MKIGIISCSVTKLNKKAKAQDLYRPSILFDYADIYARKNYDKVFYLSSKYGLIDPTQEIEPYDTYVGNFRASEVKEWSEKVINQIKKNIPKDAEIYLHIGEQFNIFTRFFSDKDTYNFKYPMEGVGGIGKQLQFYKDAINNESNNK